MGVDEWRAWLDGLSDDALADYLFDLRCYGGEADPDSDLYRFAVAAVPIVEAQLARRELLATLTTAARVGGVPDVAEALSELAQTQRELGVDDPAAVFVGALEITQRRGMNTNERGM